MIKLVLFDQRPASKTKGELQELFIGEENYSLVKIPPGIWNGWKCVGTQRALLANCPTEVHSPDEMLRMDPFSPEIPYKWDIVMK
jgi:dTDP-4-dehydrorhamnose 3,5-epimerase